MFASRLAKMRDWARTATYACTFPGLPAIDASEFERTLMLAPDLSWEMEVFGTPALNAVLRDQQARPTHMPLGWRFGHRPSLQRIIASAERVMRDADPAWCHLFYWDALYFSWLQSGIVLHYLQVQAIIVDR